MSDKNFKVKNGIDAVGPITISPSSNSVDGIVINTPIGGKAIRFIRVGSGEIASIDEWGGFTTSGGISVVQPWYTRTPGLESQSFFWAGSSARSAAGFGGTGTGTNPVIYISQAGTSTNDLTQWLKPDNTILAKVDYLGNITANDLILAGNLIVNGTTTNLNSTNLVIEDKNIIIADVATPTDTTADGAGITIKGATDKTINWVQSTGYFTSSEPFIINTTSTTRPSLIVKAIASQTSNHLEVQDSASLALFTVKPYSGNALTSSEVFVKPAGTGGRATIGANIQYGGFAMTVNTGQSLYFGTLGGGSSLEVVTSDSYNRYKILGQGTGVAPILTTDGLDTDVNMNIYPKGAGKIGINTTSPAGYVHIKTSSTSVQTLIVQGITSQSADLQQWRDANGSVLTNIDTGGYIRTPLVEARPTNPGLYGIAIAANASQSGDLFQITDASNNAYTGVSSTGKLVTGNTTNASRFTQLTSAAVGQLTVYAPTSSTIGTVIRGATSQTADLQQWQDSTGTALLKVNATGNIVSPNIAYFGTSSLFNATLNVQPVVTNWAGIVIRGLASQTANLQEWQNSAGTVLANISASGVITSTAKTMYLDNGTLRFGYGGGNIGSNLAIGNTALNNNTTGTDNFALGSYSMYNTTTGGYNVAVGTGTLYWNVVGAGNTAIGLSALNNNTSFDNTAIGIMALVNSTSGYANSGLGSGTLTSNTTASYNTAVGRMAGTMFTTGGNNTVVGATSFYHSSTTSTGVNNTALGYGAGAGNTGSSNLFLGYSAGSQETGSNKLYIANSNTTTPLIGGDFSVKTLAFAGNATITSQATGTVGLIVKGTASQTANLQEWQNSAGTVLASIGETGKFYVASTVTTAPSAEFVINSSNPYPTFLVRTAAGAWINYVGANGTTMYNNTLIAANLATQIPLTVKGATSQTANLQEWQDSAGTVVARVATGGTLISNGAVYAPYFQPRGGLGVYIDMESVSSTVSIIQRTTTAVNLIVKAVASQTANLQEWQNNAGTVLAKIDTYGTFQNGTATGYGAWINVQPALASDKGIIVRGATSQTANLQEWQNSAGTALTSVDASGNITDASNTAWLSPIGSGSNDATAIQTLIDAGKKEIRLGSGQWTFSTRIKVPNGVTLRGIGTSRSSITGTRVNAVALIASEGTVRDIMFTGAGENAQSELGGGGIAVLGGRVIDCSVNDSRWVLAPTRQAHGYLKNFMSKMQGTYGSVKVAVLGDSLSENTSTTSWYGYLFNTATTATGYYLGSYFGHQIAPSEVDNMAIGGQGAYLLSAQLAMTKDTVRTGDYVNQVLDGDSVSTSPFFSRDYSLAILAIGQNGGEDWKAHLEYTVKSIRDKGIDVIILTQNPAAGAPTSRAGDEYFYRSMAETYGCLLIDTQAYFRLEVEFGRALGTTADLFGDGIHQSALGHQLYAKAILNGILDYDSTITVPSNPVVVGRSYVPAQTDRATAIAGLNAYYLVKKPDPSRGLSGVTYTSATDSSIGNPIYGRGTTTNSVATLASGGYATWGVEYATAAYIIYRENATANTLTVAVQAGTSTLATLSTGVTDGRTSIQKVVLSGYSAVNKPIRITNTSGNPVQIYGVVFETHADVAFNRNTDGSYSGVKLNGSWAYSNLLNMVDYGSYLTPYTSTTNDSVTFKFYGNGLRFATSYGKNSGIIQVKIDETTYTAVDTYNNISEYGVYTHFYGGLQYGLHTATITLTGANAAVTGLISDGARFGIHRIAAVRSGWYLTQDQQLAPNSDISAKVSSLGSPTIGSTGGANIATFYNGTNGYGAGYISSTGTFNINGANMGFPYTSTGATLNVNAGASNIIPLTVKGVASQSADLTQWRNVSDTVIAKVDSNGTIYAGLNLYVPNAALFTTSVSNYYNATVSIDTQSAAYAGIVIRGRSSQAANLQEWQDSSATVLSRVRFDGMMLFPKAFGTRLFAGSEPVDWSNYSLYSYSTAANIITLGIQGNASQSADLTQWKNSSGTVLAKVDALGNFTATSKSFDIIHPTKENMHLRYGSLEGPENGVYIRGTAESNIIELPDYWTGLVHEDSITVSLTSVGSVQNIYIEKIENNKVYIGGDLEKAFFTVYGERKDIDKLTVEY